MVKLQIFFRPSTKSYHWHRLNYNKCRGDHLVRLTLSWPSMVTTCWAVKQILVGDSKPKHNINLEDQKYLAPIKCWWRKWVVTQVQRNSESLVTTRRHRDKYSINQRIIKTVCMIVSCIKTQVAGPPRGQCMVARRPVPTLPHQGTLLTSQWGTTLSQDFTLVHTSDMCCALSSDPRRFYTREADLCLEFMIIELRPWLN